MTPAELTAARRTLGERWGFGRPLHMSEMGRALGLSGKDPGQSIRDYERGKPAIRGPMATLVRVYLGGAVPPDGLDAIRG